MLETGAVEKSKTFSFFRMFDVVVNDNGRTANAKAMVIERQRLLFPVRAYDDNNFRL